MKLVDIIERYTTLSIIGMSKNSGKTTALNSIVEQFDSKSKTLALTSIGRDGEEVDIVTSTEKPKIYVKNGTIIATAKKMVFECDTAKEILKTTGINTPLGEIIIFKARSDGYVQTAGPSMNDQIVTVCEDLKKLGADKVIVDGALHRKSISSPNVTEATILCTGASFGKRIDKVVEETEHVYRILSLEQVEEEVINIVKRREESEKVIVIDGDFSYNSINLQTTLDTRVNVKPFVSENTKYIFLAGVVTDSILEDMSKQNINLRKIKFIAMDSSKVIVKPETYNKILMRGSNILVLKKTNLVAITINPVSAYGYNFDKNEFKERLETRVKIPVLNVLD